MGTEPRCGARCAGLPGILCVLGVVWMSSGIPVSGAESAKDYFRVESVETDRALTEMLSVRSVGWLGSDVAHSIPVTDEMSIWLSYTAAKTAEKRAQPARTARVRVATVHRDGARRQSAGECRMRSRELREHGVQASRTPGAGKKAMLAR